MDKDLEQTETGKEQAEVTPKVEPTETTPKAEEVISGEDKEKEFQERLSKLQSTKDAEIAEAIKKADKAEREAKANSESFQKQGKDLDALRNKRFELQALLDEREAELTGDPDTARKVKAQIRQAEQRVEEADRKIKERETELDRREFEAWQWDMSRKAEALQAQYGVPMEDLYKATDEKDMELIAYKFALTKKAEEKKTEVKTEPEEKTPEFDPSVSSGGGGSDDAFLEKFNKGELNSPEDYARVQKILDKIARGG